MPRNRNSNAANGKAPKSSQAARPSSGAPLVAASAWHDIGGVALVVLAVAMAITLVNPSSAVLSSACRTFLTYGFGVGAMLVPCALLLYALTFFLPSDGPLSARAALGLTLVVTAVLGMLSTYGIQLPAQDFGSVASVVFEGTWACAHGGYWGGALAWLLLSLFGDTIALVVLVGMVVTGVVVCGFSITGLVEKVRDVHAQASEQRSERKSQRLAAKQKQAALAADDGEAAPAGLFGRAKTSKAQTGETSFLGSRKTSVLRRGAQDDKDQGPAPKTGRLRRHPPLEQEPADEPAGDWELEPEDDASEAAEGVLSPLPVQPANETVRLERARGKKQKRRAKAVTPPWMEAPADDHADGEDEPEDDSTTLSPAEPDAAPKTTKLDRASKKPSKKSAKKAAAPEGAVSDSAAAIVAAAVGEQGGGTRLKAPSADEVKRPGDESGAIELPPMDILTSNPNSAASSSTDAELRQTAERLQNTLEEFGLKSRVKGWVSGPLVTTFKIEMGEGERVNKITNLEDDIALSLAAASVRIFAPIPGTSLVGIEIPNRKRNNVCLGDVLPFAKGGPLQAALGRDSEGSPAVVDLAALPHLLVAGTTGSGKSVMLNSAIMSVLMRATPEQVRMIMVDPKRVEFTGYAGLPHLYVPVVNEPQKAASALQWGVTEMERRLKVFERAGARDIRSFNKMVEQGKFDDSPNPPEHMPYLLIVIDELADLMMVAGKDVEASIVRIAQLGRAAGIHLIVATQRPSADVVTGLIKANIDNRIALSVDNGMNSRIIIDQKGAEKLLGNGDMLVKLRGKKPVRVQGCYVSDPEIEAAVDFLRSQGEPDYHDEILSAVAPSPLSGGGDFEEDDDPLVWEAAAIVVDSQLGSTSGLQRRLKVGYARAGRIMDMLEHKGVVGPPDGSKPREVLLDAQGLEELRRADEAYREV